MEEAIARGFVGFVSACGVALVAYGILSNFLDGETIREFAEVNAVAVAAVMGAICLL